MVTGVVSLVCVAAWLICNPAILATYHYSPNAVAITHLFALGWLCSVVMGAIYQLVPVALESKLYSEKLVLIQYALHVAGVTGMVLAFHCWNMKLVGWAGSIFATGVCLFVYNIVRTLLRIPRRNVVALSVTSALAWILLTLTVGLLMAEAKTGHANFMFRFSPLGAMHTHAHLGVIGFFMMLIVGVSYKLIPMFTLSEVQSRARATASIVLLNIGLTGSLFSILLQSPLKPVFAIVIIFALALYGCELIAIIRARKRRALDWGVKYFLTAIALLIPLSIIALILSWSHLPFNAFTGQLENAYGFLAFAGPITFAVMGMLYKIIPFLVWYGVYSSHIGKARVPALADMYSARLQMIAYLLFLAALAVTTIGILNSSPSVVRMGCVFFAANVAIFAINTEKILSHYFRPRINPLITAKTKVV
jgi:cbb3-type cytochrome oxidase subunit 1